MNNIKILIAGVGGQGTLYTSKVLGAYAAHAGLDCKLNEVHGMSQRGGSVVTHVIFGEKVFSPVIGEGAADVLLSFELLEAVRHLNYLKPGGILISARTKILPLPVLTGDAEYPQSAELALLAAVGGAVFVDALTIAERIGSARFANSVLIGLLTKKLGLDFELMKKAVADCTAKKFIDQNITALNEGYGLVI